MHAYGTATTIATEFGVSRQYLSRLCKEDRIPSWREASTSGGPERLIVTHMDLAAFLLQTSVLDVHDCPCSQGAYQKGKEELLGEVQALESENESLRAALASTRAELADKLKSSVLDTVTNTATPAHTVAPTLSLHPPAASVVPATAKPTSEEREAAYDKELRQVLGIRHNRPLTDEEKQQARTLREQQQDRQGRRGGLFGSRKG